MMASAMHTIVLVDWAFQVKNIHVTGKRATFDELMEHDEAKEKFPDSEYVNGRMHIAQRNAELEPQEDDWKGRFIVGGHNVRDVHNLKVVDNVIQSVPASVSEAKVGNCNFAHSARSMH